MKTLKRIVALACALMLCVALAIPAHADGELVPVYNTGWSSSGSLAGSNNTFYDIVGFGDVINHSIDISIDTVQNFAHTIKGVLDSSYCEDSPNHRHSFVPQHTTVDGETKNFYCCEYCRETAGEVFEAQYTDAVTELPLNGYDSEGGYYWQAQVSDIDFTKTFYFNMHNDAYDLSLQNHNFVSQPYEITQNSWVYTFSNNSDGIGVDMYPYYGESEYRARVRYYGYFTPPVTGQYLLVSSYGGDVTWTDYADTTSVIELQVPSGSSYNRTAGTSFMQSQITMLQNGNDSSIKCSRATSVHAKVYLPKYLVTPTTTPDTTSTTLNYTNNSRPASISGDYGVIGDNNEVYISNDTYIFNETTNELTNPATGDTTTYDSWQYDYSTRTYTLTENSNNTTSTVTYGDEYVTINEGGNTYTVNYLIDHSYGVSDDNGGGNGGNGGSGSGDDISLPSNSTIDALGLRLREFFSSVPEMIGDINDFLTDAFPYIPADLLAILEFTISLSCLMAIIKMMRR